jgi:hypothetical protein
LALGMVHVERNKEIIGAVGSDMMLFNRIFTAKALVLIICMLSAAVVMKGLGAHYDFKWASALTAG